MSLNNIVIEQITDNYYRGEFLGLNLIIDKNTGYFNATKLCQDGKKPFSNWYRSKKTKELFKYISKIRHPSHVKGDELYEVKSGQQSKSSKKEVAGTYVCKELILNIASWISHEFYLKCNEIIISHATEEFKKKYETTIKEKDCKINELSGQVKELIIEIREMRGELNNANGKLDEVQCELGDVKDELGEVRDQLDSANSKLDLALPDRNIDPTDDDLKHNYILFKSKTNPNEYVFIRGQDKHIELTKRKYNSTFEITIDKTKNPNPIDMTNRLKERIKIINETGYADIITSIRKSNEYYKGTPTQKRLMVTSAQKSNAKIIHSSTKITLVSFEEEKFIELIKELDQEKFNVY